MKKYIFSRKKLQEDSAVAEITENMNWPKDADGCEVFFTDGDECWHTIGRSGGFYKIHPEWCEVVEDNGDAPTTALNP